MLHLQEMAKYGQQARAINISERLPNFITAPCNLNVTYQVEAKNDFYLVETQVEGELQIQCQRCLEEFKYPYKNDTVVAVCRDDKRAEALLEQYECIVSGNFNIGLDDLIIDELHLYAPQFHPENTDCSSDIDRFITGNIDTN